jgi:hypothetical protein
MSSNKREVGTERRSSDRVIDDSILLISGYNTSGLPFSETAKIRDVSHGGISFHLKTLIETDAVLDVSICRARCEEGPFSPIFGVQARVLRVSKRRTEHGLHLVAAQFKGEVTKLSGAYENEQIAQELQEAIEFDEKIRYLG